MSNGYFLFYSATMIFPFISSWPSPQKILHAKVNSPALSGVIDTRVLLMNMSVIDRYIFIRFEKVQDFSAVLSRPIYFLIIIPKGQFYYFIKLYFNYLQLTKYFSPL